VEAAFPFSAFEGEEHFAATVEVTEPFGIFGIFEVLPEIVVQLEEPFQAFSVACKLVTLDHADSGFEVHPP